MKAKLSSAIPGPLGPWQYLQNILYYLHGGLATVVIGLIGLPWVALRGARAANGVATFWIGYMLWAARLHMGVTCELRGPLPEGDCIIAAKHQCFLDILAIAQAMPRRAFIMKKEVMRVPVMAGMPARWAVSRSTVHVAAMPCVPFQPRCSTDAPRPKGWAS